MNESTLGDTTIDNHSDDGLAGSSTQRSEFHTMFESRDFDNDSSEGETEASGIDIKQATQQDLAFLAQKGSMMPVVLLLN